MDTEVVYKSTVTTNDKYIVCTAPSLKTRIVDHDSSFRNPCLKKTLLALVCSPGN